MVFFMANRNDRSRVSMKKSIAASMSLVLAAGILTGCGGNPGKKETLERLEDQCGGENIEIVDKNLARSLDRDLEFTYSYEWEGTPIWPDIDIDLGGKYILETGYDDALHKYWNDEYRKCIEKYNFAEVDYGRHADEEIFLSPNAVYIYIENGASEEDLKKVESLLLDLREICREEEDFHSWDCSRDFGYLAYIWYIDSDAEVYQKTDGTWIAADTKDKYLQLDNISIRGTESSDPRDEEYGSGKAKIFVN